MKSTCRLLLKIIYMTSLYLGLCVSYFLLQEFYVENCTARAGLIQMMLGLPACNHVLRILQFVGDYFIAIVVGLTTFTTISIF